MDMPDENIRKKTVLKMYKARSMLVGRRPFYGSLLMNLQLGAAYCGTAATDMEHIVFDPEFADRISLEEMMFVMQHEVLHCALSHCTRGKGRQHYRFNVACDIVVNSTILRSMGVDEFNVDGVPAMHLAPNGKEGYLYTAEQVYQMLGDLPDPPDEKRSSDGAGNAGDGADTDGSDRERFDSHELWDTVEETSSVEDRWKKIVKDTAGKYASSVKLPPSLREYVKKLDEDEQVDWRAALADFVQVYYDRFDFTFMPADRRFAASDYVIPSFAETEDENYKKLWFCMDTSGSVSTNAIGLVYAEIRAALNQLNGLEGMLSFFDTDVTEPQPFEDEETLMAIRPTGGGGTSFHCIFKYMAEHMNETEEDLPVAVIILTDGYAWFPREEAALGVPVLWVICDSMVEPPWGRCVHIETKLEKRLKYRPRGGVLTEPQGV